MLGAISSLLPDPLADMRGEIRERLRRIPTELNEYGYDPFGLHPETLEDVMLFGAFLYHYWFRVETHGIERVPQARAPDRAPQPGFPTPQASPAGTLACAYISSARSARQHSPSKTSSGEKSAL
jgi:hypothetical protein